MSRGGTSPARARSIFRRSSIASTISDTAAGSVPNIRPREKPRRAWRGQRITCKLHAEPETRMNTAAPGLNFLRPADVAARRRRLLPPDTELHTGGETRACECDGLSAYRQLPMGV